MEQGPPLILNLRALGWALNLTRASLILFAITAVLLSASPGQDLLRSVAEDGGLKYLSLYGGTLLWAGSLWFWSRIQLDIRYPYALIEGRQLSVYRRELPRLLGGLAFVVVMVNLSKATDWYATIFLLGLEGLLFLLAIIYRPVIGRWIARSLQTKAPEAHWAWSEAIGSEQEPPPLDLTAILNRNRLAAASLMLGLALFIWGMAAPLSMGLQLDSLLLLMLWSATLLPLVTILTYYGTRLGLPILTILLVLMVTFSFFNNNHDIRRLDSGFTPGQRPTLEQALTQWHDTHCDERGCEPFILVASAGGGISAAYWTGTLLGRLQDESGGRFDDQLFAISGVSGGSLGATVFRAVTADRDTDVSAPIQQILGQDYLGPLSAGLLYRDAVQRLLPLPVLSDRAALFEQGLETGFRAVIPQGRVSLESSFIETASVGNRPWPALFLNATWSENGRRIVAASLRTGTLAPPDGDLVLYQDMLNALGGDIRLSTAAHNSARFPLISPPGGWRPADDQTVAWQNLQDGGLFEDSGAETLLEIATVAEALWQERWGMALQPHVLMISSDPNLAVDPADFPYNAPLGYGYELLNELISHATSPATLLSYATRRTGHGRGAEATSRLQRWVERQTPASEPSRFFHLRMCPGEETQPKASVGWSLSATAQMKIAGDLAPDSNNNCIRENDRALKELIELLRPTRKPRPPSPPVMSR